ncbi:CHAT domain-containing protein [Actinoplanes bogorensis]|uniref:CHAT domain-containing protein n=1 Tax=Paractinoplanes bogorensis TaxID=1610840 RepID=A0ABS5YZW6_9ACTN|nr:CHAT domain-containing protein [Actinoplanes bogorensis]MBU2668239.1 CHAT domain-containing protein [Actinoplanes bogorensis]
MTTPVSTEDQGRIARIVWAVAGGGGDLDAAIGDFERLAAEAPGRSALAAALVHACVRGRPQTVPARYRALAGLVTAADHDPPPAEQWRPLRAAACALALGQSAADGELPDLGAALAEIDALAAEAAAEPALAPVFASVRLGLEFGRAVTEGDAAATEDLLEQAATFAAAAGGAMADLMVALKDLMTAQRRGDDLKPLMARLRTVSERLPDGDPVRTAMEDALAQADILQTGGRPDPDLVPPGAADRALSLTVLGTAGLAEETDPDRIAAAIATLREALAGIDPAHHRRPFHLTALALALYRQSEVMNRVDRLPEAEELLVEARRLTGGPGNLHSTWIAEMLADVRYRLGRSPGGHVGAVDAMGAHLWQVLAQPDLRSATVAARHAATDAADIARKCLVANDPAEAARALDSGRGLALFAATQVRTVAERLDTAGQDDLAARWRAAVAGGTGPSRALRRDVLEALSDTDLGWATTRPPGPDEIGAALAAVDADALIYLLPADGPVPGYAVMVSAHGSLSYSALPELRLDAAPDLDAYLAASEPTHLDALCDWAWRAAIGPIYRGYLARITPPARPPRVVLVPMGVLARVPWHAARRRDGTYAVQLIAISQAASARLFCHSAGLAPVPPQPLGLIVGDPLADLPSARTEAYAVHRSFYLGARYVGRRPDGSRGHSGSGTRADLDRWLATTGPGAGSMLHMACHGIAEPGGSWLQLADGKLAASSLGGTLDRVPDRPLGLVVLAACSTGRSVTGYDEAYSLGTAFLAAGARTVLSTQWKVPDHGTSVLMYAFHRGVMVDRLAPWDALRRAQLWMLDPRRRIWPDMPEPLREQAERPEAAAVVSWAGFVHGGR